MSTEDGWIEPLPGFSAVAFMSQPRPGEFIGLILQAIDRNQRVRDSGFVSRGLRWVKPELPGLGVEQKHVMYSRPLPIGTP